MFEVFGFLCFFPSVSKKRLYRSPVIIYLIEEEYRAKIERKFQVTEEIVDYCTRHHLEERSLQLVDRYFDTHQYDLTKKDIWLRERNQRWELKVPNSQSNGSGDVKNRVEGVDVYTEIKDNALIWEKLRSLFPSHDSSIMHQPMEINPDLLAHFAGLKPFLEIHSNRKRFRLLISLPKLQTNQEVFIDIDSVSYDPAYITIAGKDKLSTSSLQYRIGEIELIPPISAIHSPAVIMKEIFDGLQIDTSAVRGKVLEYLYRFRPEHYEALKESGQLGSKGISA